MDQKLLLILYLDQGRHFPRLLSEDAQIQICAHLEQDRLSTANLEWTDRPLFQEELAWRITLGQLQDFRQGQTCIHIEAFCIQPSKSDRQSLGFCRIDISQAKPNTIYRNDDSLVAYHCHWLKLTVPELTMASPEKCPQIKVDLVFEEESPEILEVSSGLSNHLQPVLDEEHGYFILGDKDRATDVFYFVYRFIVGLNLAKAIPKDVVLPDNPRFHFFFDFFGADVQSNYFFNLKQTEIDSEIARAKFKTNPEDLALYFNEMVRPLKVFLLCGEQCLAKVKIHFPNFLHVNASTIRQSPKKVESLVFFGSKNVKKSRSSTSKTEEPLLGIGLELIHGDTLEQEVIVDKEIVDLTGKEEGDVDEEISVMKTPSPRPKITPSVFEDADPSSQTGFKRKLEETVSELELWKLQQKRKFQDQLKEVEAHHNEVFAGEWRKREEQRESVFQEKFHEISQLAERLKKALAQVEQREKDVITKESEILKKEKILEVRETQVNQQKKAVSQDWKTKCESLETENNSLKEKLAQLERENGNLKANEVKSKAIGERNKTLEDVKHKLETENNILKRDIQRLAQSKESYKKAWEKAEDEVKAVKSLQERQILDELKEARNEIQRLRNPPRPTLIELPSPQASPKQTSKVQEIPQKEDECPFNPPKTTERDSSSAAGSELFRLRENRRILLKTGNYSEDSEAIKSLDASIARIMSSSQAEKQPEQL
ncbi:hypothetical protein TCAL_02268 [Tigriopus californicus]|uniref:DUF3668 domain-containing protein n=1 Tax=Tigriopus californicus TaxID=6832 RepID=A0A553NPG9_TIGCA|nr:centrosomal protein of 120 kDa-like [Tigriopus californicus]TRY67300.1 hypothetical protein TCAL_02268 [Tigriopus californicus]|eukprot:TCALIF_02268-PA protein Name:"Similar to cep120 Centrosomal protein of 120 kDa (Xenopus tropicalis)" AED:0.00 eAED:0.00 QI:83/1/1/1/1/1/6/17/713